MLTWNLLVIYNQLTIEVSDRYAETSIILPTDINGEEARALFDFASEEGVLLFKQIVTDNGYETYTNDPDYVSLFSSIASNGEVKLFAKRYQVELGAPELLGGTINVKGMTENFEHYLTENFDGIQISEGIETPKMFYILRVINIIGLFVMLGLCGVAITLSKFEEEKREILLYELNGNRNFYSNKIKGLFVALILSYLIISMFIFGVNTIYEMMWLLVSVLVTSLILGIIIFIVAFEYKVKVINSFQKHMQIRKKRSLYVFVCLLAVFVPLAALTSVKTISIATEVSGDIIAFMAKPESVKNLYTSTGALNSQLSLDTLEKNSVPTGMYEKIYSTENSIKINCEYAFVQLGASECREGVYTSDEILNILNTEENQLIINPLDTSSGKIVNPSVEIVEPEIVTSGMYWTEPIENNILNVKKNKEIFIHQEKEKVWALILEVLKLIVVLLIMKVFVKLFKENYKVIYMREDTLKMINGRQFRLKSRYIALMIIIVVLFFVLYKNYYQYSIYSIITIKQQVEAQVLSVILIAFLWDRVYVNIRDSVQNDANRI